MNGAENDDEIFSHSRARRSSPSSAAAPFACCCLRRALVPTCTMITFGKASRTEENAEKAPCGRSSDCVKGKDGVVWPVVTLLPSSSLSPPSAAPSPCSVHARGPPIDLYAAHPSTWRCLVMSRRQGVEGCPQTPVATSEHSLPLPPHSLALMR